MPNAAQPLVDYLLQLQEQGHTHVHVDDEAKSILRQFYQNQRKAPAKQTVKAIPASEPVSQPTEPTSTPQINQLSVSGNTPAEKIVNLKQQAENWQPARALDSLRSTMVFSVGDPVANIMLVGEAPGHDEERLREPFVGKAGQKLNGILTAMGITREQTYISNIVKFRPAMPNQTTNNRKPTREEMDAWMPFIETEIQIVQPKVIIALGATAAQALLATNAPVGKMRGQFHDYRGTPLRVTYHPSYILHNDTTSEKRKLWEDMLEVMKLLSMTISEKQQGYFLPKSS